MTSVQESSSQSLTTKALDKTGEVEAGQAGGSTKESDEKFEGDFTKQVTKDHLEEEKAGDNGEDEGSGKKEKMPRAGRLLSWWKKRWPASGDLQSKVHKEKENYPRTEPDKDPDEADKEPDTTCVGEPQSTGLRICWE